MTNYSTEGPMRDPQVRNHFVYRLFDDAGALMYVGCSMRPMKRIKEHQSMRPEMVARIAKVKVQGPFNYQTAREIERAAIQTEEPLVNGPAARSQARQQDLHRRWTTRFHDLKAQGLSSTEAGDGAASYVRLVALGAAA